jgi:hypothetical protein
MRKRHSRAVFWRTGAFIITVVGVLQLAWLHHSGPTPFRKSAKPPIGLSEVWSDYRASPDASPDWDVPGVHRQPHETTDGLASSGGTNQQTAFKREENWCSESEYLDGEWVTRDEVVTMDNIRKIFGYTESGRLQCQAREAGRESQPSINDPEYWARVTEAAQYVWKPKSGCRQHKLDAWNIAKYCLRSKGGCS